MALSLFRPVYVYVPTEPIEHHQLSELTTQLSETIGQAEARARDEGRLRSELKRLQITAQRCFYFLFFCMFGSLLDLCVLSVCLSFVFLLEIAVCWRPGLCCALLRFRVGFAAVPAIAVAALFFRWWVVCCSSGPDDAQARASCTTARPKKRLKVASRRPYFSVGMQQDAHKYVELCA